MASLYQDLSAANVPCSNWQSDLHFKDTPTSREIVAKHPQVECGYFKNQIDGSMWREANFQYDPYWNARG